ncbi:MAG: transglycosylase SLT domain-containing protein [Deltaproteobacteria bacterium]|nr:transglycosylase SLT domain-containing protein [Deltaproteobacteria bacterium]
MNVFQGVSVFSGLVFLFFTCSGCTHYPSAGSEVNKSSLTVSSSSSPESPTTIAEYTSQEESLHSGRSGDPDLGYLKSLISRASIHDCVEFAHSLHTVRGKGMLRTDFPVVTNDAVRDYIKYFQTDIDFMTKALERATTYSPMMQGILKEEHLPEDLVFLALIESGFNPCAYSRAGACGPWQFMPETARRYGLKINLWVDERRDPEKSTRAAARYLKDLYAMFGDWHLAVAAYNAGEQRVATAIKKNKIADFWALRKGRDLAPETRDFVPKLVAAILIGKHPEEYGFSPPLVQKRVALTSFTIPQPTELKFIAEMAGIPLESLKQSNPELRKWCTPPNKKGYEVKIPASNRDLFAQNLSRNREKFLSYRTFHEHRIKPGETLYNIARRYNTKVAHIQEINRIRNPRLIHPGKIIIIPIPPIVSSS